MCYIPEQPMDIFDREAHARKQTSLLIWLFGLAVVAVVVLTYLVLAGIIQFFIRPVWQTSLYDFLNDFPVSPLHDGLVHPRHFMERLWNPTLFCWTTVGTLLLIAVGCLYKIRLLAAGGPAVAELLGGRRLASSPSDLDEQRLRDVVEEMAVASGMPVPKIYVLDRERGINTFAAGHTREDVAVGVTFGALKLLTRDELQGVIAHEFSHVLNGDTRLNLKLMGLAHGLFWPTIVGRVLLRGSPQPAEVGASIFDEDSKPVHPADRTHRNLVSDHRWHQLAIRAPAQKPDLPRTRMAGRRSGGAIHAQSGGHRGRTQKNRRALQGRPTRHARTQNLRAICILLIPPTILGSASKPPTHHWPGGFWPLTRHSTASSLISSHCRGRQMTYRRRPRAINCMKKISAGRGQKPKPAENLNKNHPALTPANFCPCEAGCSCRKADL